MSGLDSLPAHARKCAAARLLVREALATVAEDLDDDALRALEPPIARVDGEADHAFAKPVEDDEPFESFLRRLPDVAVGSPSAAERPLVEALAEAFRRRVEEHLEGSLDAVARAWPVAVELAMRLYKLGGESLMEASHPRLKLAFTTLVPHPFRIDGIALGGDVDDERIVHLLIQPPGLTAEAARALPYVLVHELVCHALAARPPREPPSFEFGEGWMDAVAHDLVDASTRIGTPVSDLGERLDDALGTRRAAGTLHDARLRPGDDRRGWSARLVGADAAARVALQIAARRLHEGDAQETSWRLAVALSRSGMSAALLDRFCVRVNKLLKQASSADSVTQPLERWLAAQDGLAGAALVAATEQFVTEVMLG